MMPWALAGQKFKKQMLPLRSLVTQNHVEGVDDTCNPTMQQVTSKQRLSVPGAVEAAWWAHADMRLRQAEREEAGCGGGGGGEGQHRPPV